LFDGFAVALVEIAGPVVGGSLGAHVVACSGDENKVVYRKIMVVWGSEYEGWGLSFIIYYFTGLICGRDLRINSNIFFWFKRRIKSIV
jgi:hypothetical protein